MNDCIIWRGSISRNGYAKASTGTRRGVLVHRYVYEWINGPIPGGLLVLHSCDVRACVNPSHLRLGTHAENMQDMVLRKRQARGEHHGRARVTERQVSEIRSKLDAGTPVSEIARQFGVSKYCVYDIKLGRKWLESSSSTNPNQE